MVPKLGLNNVCVCSRLAGGIEKHPTAVQYVKLSSQISVFFLFFCFLRGCLLLLICVNKKSIECTCVTLPLGKAISRCDTRICVREYLNERWQTAMPELSNAAYFTARRIFTSMSFGDSLLLICRNIHQFYMRCGHLGSEFKMALLQHPLWAPSQCDLNLLLFIWFQKN